MIKVSRIAAVLSGLALLVLTGCPGGPADSAGDSRPSAILLITVDGLSAEQLALFGGERSAPALEELAASGSAWGDAWTVSPMTRPAVATYLTGLAPDHHGVRDDLFSFLDESTPTLATRLAEQGYRTAAFPDSSFLGFSSGLLRGFEIVDDAPEVPFGPARWLPVTRPPDESASNFQSWLDTVPSGTDYFAWLHFTEPLNGLWFPKELNLRTLKPREKAEGEPRTETPRVKAKAKRRAAKATSDPIPKRPPTELTDPPSAAASAAAAQSALTRFDDALRHIVDALRVRGELDGALVIVAGTQGDPMGGESEPPGPGFSLGPQAVEVPVIVHLPRGAESGRDADTPVWGPDVPATIADLVQVELAPGAEGESLLRPVDGERVLLAWSWAPLDQVAWPALRAARIGDAVLHETPDVASDGDERLASALAARRQLAAPSVQLETIRPLLTEFGIDVDPLSPEDRELGSAADRRRLMEYLWTARAMMRKGGAPGALRVYSGISALDAANLGEILDRGQIFSVFQPARGKRVLERGLRLYPTNLELLHWYAHAIWKESNDSAEQLLTMILPFKPQEADVLYDLACARSLNEDFDASESFLRRAIEAGYRNWQHIETDSDLRNLRESGRLSELLREYRR